MTQEPFWRDDSVTIWHADALALPLPNESVDLVVTSPPYFGLRSYQDGGEHYEGQIGDEPTPAEFVDALIAATGEMVRALKPSGSVWVNLGDKYVWGGSVSGIPAKSLVGVPWRYALRCIDEMGLILRAEVIWSKPNGLPESVTDRVRRSHETWFHLVKQPDYFAAVDEIREPHSEHTLRYYGPGTAAKRRPVHEKGAGTAANPSQYRHQLTSVGAQGKLPGSVWEVPSQPLRVPAHLPQHFAAFPLEWPRRIIQGWCPDSGVVLDPFAGTGATALAARVLGRRAHLVDLSRDYCRLAQWRVNDPGEIARAMQVEKPSAEPEGMDSLLDLLGEDGAA